MTGSVTHDMYRHISFSELHRSGSSFMSQSHVTCHTNVITKMVLFGFVGHNYSFPYFYLILSRAISLSIFAYVKVLPIPSYLSMPVGMYPYHLITHSLSYLILSTYPNPKSGGKQGLCAGCPPLYTCGPVHRPWAISHDHMHHS